MQTRRAFLICAGLLAAVAGAGQQPLFVCQELLGRVSARSATVNAEADTALDIYFEYGTAPGVYDLQTTVTRFPGGQPFEVVLDRLQPNTRYYYRMNFRVPGSSVFTPRAEHSFQTQRPRGSTFTFDIEFDPHMDDNSDAAGYALTMANEALDKPDFLISLGDTFMSDKLQPPTEQGVLDRVHLLRSYYDLLCHSSPLYLTLGNHEGEWGRFLDGTTQNVAVWDTIFRRQHMPNPEPDDFYSGDTTTYPLVGRRQSYFSWEWGDALFVVLDPYWSQPTAPEQSGSWSLTLGRPQYDWLKKTLEASSATYKFVFAHNLVGGVNPNGLGPMRGGVEAAKYLEWGGYNLDGTWGFEKARPGWPMPIHQLLVANNVTAFFHGHDHLYAKQDLDGIVYQEGPQPSARNTSLGNRAADYGYTHGTLIGGAGYIRVQVSPEAVKVEYVQTWTPAGETATRKNRAVADSYTIPARRTNLAIVSAASYARGEVAPGSIVSAFGDGLSAGSVSIRDSLGVERSGQVLGRNATQVNFVVPAGTALGRAQATIGGALGDMLVNTVAPGLFSANASGQGIAAAVAVHVNGGGSQTTELVFGCGSEPGSCVASPISMGPPTDQVYLCLFGTGLRNRSSMDDVAASIGGETADVLYAGPQPEFEGLDQINLRIPRALEGRGEVPVSIRVAGRSANEVTVAIR